MVIIHRSPMDSPHKGQWRGALLLSLISAWTNGRANYQRDGDLRRHRAHYDSTVMMIDDGQAKPATRAPSQYPKRRLSVRSRKVSKSRDLYLELSDRSEIWQALRQQCCRCACQISKRYDDLKFQSRGFETLRDLTKIRLFGYWDGSQGPMRSGYWMFVSEYTLQRGDDIMIIYNHK